MYGKAAVKGRFVLFQRAVIVSESAASVIAHCLLLVRCVQPKYIGVCLCSSHCGLCCSAHAPVCASGSVSSHGGAGSTKRALIKTTESLEARLALHCTQGRALHPSTHTHTPASTTELSSSKTHKKVGDWEIERRGIEERAGIVRDKIEMRSENADEEETDPGVNEKLLSGQQRPFRGAASLESLNRPTSKGPGRGPTGLVSP